MKDNRRGLLKQISLTGAAVLIMPEMLAAKCKKSDCTNDVPISKTFLFKGDSIIDGGRSYNKD